MRKQPPAAGSWSWWQALSTTQVVVAETTTHLFESTSASHRGAAASLLPISRSLMAAPFAKATTCRCLIITAASTLHHPSAGGTDEHAPLSPPPPPTVEQPQACSTSRSFMAASVAKANTCRCLITAASTLHHPSAGGRDHYTPRVRLHIAPWSSRTLASTSRTLQRHTSAGTGSMRQSTLHS